MPEETNKKKCAQKKQPRQTESIERFQSKKRAVDSRIDALKMRDNVRQKKLSDNIQEDFDIIRFRFLKLKKANGGLTVEEEEEFEFLLGGV
jgi:hypothetical protein